MEELLQRIDEACAGRQSSPVDQGLDSVTFIGHQPWYYSPVSIRYIDRQKGMVLL